MSSVLSDNERLSRSRPWPAGPFILVGCALMGVAVLMFAGLALNPRASLWMIALGIILAGVMQLAHGISLFLRGGSKLWVARGLVQVIAGFAIWAAPSLALAPPTLMACAALILSGTFGIFLATKSKADADWLAMSGLLDMLVGLIVVLGWPAEIVWVPGLFLTIAVSMHGAMFAAIGLEHADDRGEADAGSGSPGRGA